MSVQIKIDNKSFNIVQKKIDKMVDAGAKSAGNIAAKVLFDIRANAQTRLKDRSHIVTSRLRNSIFVKLGGSLKEFNKSDNTGRYQDNEGNSFENRLQSVSLKDAEGAVGTNVDYGENIEKMDSYLKWAVKNSQRNAQKYAAEVAKKFNKYLK